MPPAEAHEYGVTAAQAHDAAKATLEKQGATAEELAAARKSAELCGHNASRMGAIYLSRAKRPHYDTEKDTLRTASGPMTISAVRQACDAMEKPLKLAHQKASAPPPPTFKLELATSETGAPQTSFPCGTPLFAQVKAENAWHDELFVVWSIDGEELPTSPRLEMKYQNRRAANAVALLPAHEGKGVQEEDYRIYRRLSELTPGKHRVSLFVSPIGKKDFHHRQPMVFIRAEVELDCTQGRELYAERYKAMRARYLKDVEWGPPAGSGEYKEWQELTRKWSATVKPFVQGSEKRIHAALLKQAVTSLHIERDGARIPTERRLYWQMGVRMPDASCRKMTFELTQKYVDSRDDYDKGSALVRYLPESDTEIACAQLAAR
jgi:hypothetical protein